MFTHSRMLFMNFPLRLPRALTVAQPTPGLGNAMHRPGVGRFRPQFRGQQPGESLVFAIQPHPLYALFASWRTLLFALLAGVLWVAAMTLDITLSPFVTTLLAVATLILPLGRLLLDELNLYLNRRYILTDWRVIDVRGFFFRRSKDLVLQQIQQVVVERPNILATWLDIGAVIILSGGERNSLRLEWVRHPSQVSRQIQSQQLAARPRASEAVELRNPLARAVIQQLARDEQSTPPAAKLSKGDTSTAEISVPFELLSEHDEHVIERIPRHWSALANGEWRPALVGIVGLALAVLAGAGGVDSAGLVLLVTFAIVTVWGALQYFNYADDLLILTTLRVVDLDRVLFVVAENRRQAMYDKIQNVRVVTPLLGRIFGYGTIYIETAGRSDDLQMSHIANASAVQDRIFQYMNAAAARKDARALSSRRREARRWMAEALDEVLVEVPDLHGRSVLDAAERLRAVGLRMVVDSERIDARVPPGEVLEQEPLAGSSALRGSEVRLVLSRQPASSRRGLP